jgi:Ca2+-binding RTX toxin-like protein
MAFVEGSDASETLNAADGVTNGADDIFGYGGDDNLFGLGGNDDIFGGADDDDIFGGDNNDVIRGGSGADDIDGDSGSDYASSEDSGAGVVVSLISGTGSGGEAQGDTLESIENLTG